MASHQKNSSVKSEYKYQNTFLLIAWLIWPALIAWNFRNFESDFFGLFLNEYFYYPASLNNLTQFWLKSEPIYKSIYLSTWYVNSIFLAVYYFFFLIRNKSYMEEIRQTKTNWQLFFLGIAGMGFVALWVSPIMFRIDTKIADKAAYLLSSDVGFFLVLPTLIAVLGILGVASVFYFKTIFQNLFFKESEFK